MDYQQVYTKGSQDPFCSLLTSFSDKTLSLSPLFQQTKPNQTTMSANRTTMAGMIWNANHVLTTALDPKTNGVPHKLFKQELKGILLISTIEAGFIFSGNVGSGILMARREGSWSPPCAVGLAG